MRVLVNGGAGYIGSHVVWELIERGDEVVVFDNLSAGHSASLHPDARLVVGDLMNTADVARVYDGAPFDGVMHFASHIMVGESMAEPFRYFRDNVNGLLNTLEAATRHDVRHFIFSSTAALFGDPDVMPIPADAPREPGSVYGETKLMGERILHWMEVVYGLKYCALRYFNACGAHPNGHIGEDHHPESHLIPLVLQVALGQRDHIDIYGTDYATPDGTGIRDYVHVIDLAAAHILALDALVAGGPSRQYNLGSGTGYSVREIIEAARRITEHGIPAHEAARRPGDLPVLVADSSLIQRELGWSPEFDNIGAIIQTAWQWHRTHPHGYGDG